jgi:hypothetical protein
VRSSSLFLHVSAQASSGCPTRPPPRWITFDARRASRARGVAGHGFDRAGQRRRVSFPRLRRHPTCHVPPSAEAAAAILDGEPERHAADRGGNGMENRSRGELERSVDDRLATTLHRSVSDGPVRFHVAVHVKNHDHVHVYDQDPVEPSPGVLVPARFARRVHPSRRRAAADRRGRIVLILAFDRASAASPAVDTTARARARRVVSRLACTTTPCFAAARGGE